MNRRHVHLLCTWYTCNVHVHVYICTLWLTHSLLMLYVTAMDCRWITEFSLRGYSRSTGVWRMLSSSHQAQRTLNSGTIVSPSTTLWGWTTVHTWWCWRRHLRLAWEESYWTERRRGSGRSLRTACSEVGAGAVHVHSKLEYRCTVCKCTVHVCVSIYMCTCTCMYMYAVQ